jgi:LysR family tcuABC transcriptional regulator
MDARQLRYFVQIVESGSLAKASRQLHIAQPALSQQMARLEETVGRPLLTRSARGVLPTESGHALYHHSKFLLRQFDQTIAIARQETSELSGRVTVGLAPTTVCALGLPLVRHLAAKYPRVVLNVVESLSGHLEHMARIGQLDIAVLFNQSAASEFVVQPLLEEELFVVLPAASALVAQDRTSLSLIETARLPLILPSTAHGLRRRIELELERRDLPVRPVAEIDSLPLLMSCLQAGMGVTIKPMSAVYTFREQRAQWRTLAISDAPMTRQNYLYTLPQEKLSPCAAFVRDEIFRVVRKLVEDGEWEGVTLPTKGRQTEAAFQAART